MARSRPPRPRRRPAARGSLRSHRACCARRAAHAVMPRVIEQAHDPARARQHEHDEHDADPRFPVLGDLRDVVLQFPVDDRAEDRPEERLHAAEQRHHHEVAGVRDRTRVGIDRLLVVRPQPAGDGREERREHERVDAVLVHVVAEEARADLVLANRVQHRAERRDRDPVQQHETEKDDDRREDVEVERVAEIARRQPR